MAQLSILGNQFTNDLFVGHFGLHIQTCVKHGMDWNGIDWIGMEWNGFLIFSHYETNIYAYAWMCVLCTDTVNRHSKPSQ